MGSPLIVRQYEKKNGGTFLLGVASGTVGAAGQAAYQEVANSVVVRKSGVISVDDFGESVGKMVRANHVQTSDNWKSAAIVRNELRKVLNVAF